MSVDVPSISCVLLCLAPRGRYQVLGCLPPRPPRAGARAPPPVVYVPVGLVGEVIVQHSTKSAEEIRVDELPGALPPEVGVVEVVICVQTVQVRSQFLRRLEFIHVDVGAVRRSARIVFGPGSHYNRQDIAAATGTSMLNR